MLKAVWCLSGMVTFGKRMADMCGWPLFVDCPIGEADKVFIVGMYDPPTYGYTLNSTKTAKSRHIHWCGSDVEALLMYGCADNLPEATHSCDSEALQRELKSVGISAEVMTVATIAHVPVSPLPEKPRLAVYYGTNPNKYGAEWVRFISEAMPDVEFEAFTLGQHADISPVIARTSGIVRIMDHDGNASSAREWMEAGRAAITTTDLPFADVVSKRDPAGILKTVREVIARKEPNEEAAAFYREYNSSETWLKRFEEVVDGGH